MFPHKLHDGFIILPAGFRLYVLRVTRSHKTLRAQILLKTYADLYTWLCVCVCVCVYVRMCMWHSGCLYWVWASPSAHFVPWRQCKVLCNSVWNDYWPWHELWRRWGPDREGQDDVIRRARRWASCRRRVRKTLAPLLWLIEAGKMKVNRIVCLRSVHRDTQQFRSPSGLVYLLKGSNIPPTAASQGWVLNNHRWAYWFWLWLLKFPRPSAW